jgi:hypothetical protein
MTARTLYSFDMSQRVIIVREAFAVALVLAAAGHRPAAEQVPPRILERGSEFLELSFAAVGQDGSPVADLKADELTVKIGGRARAIRSLQLISFDGGAAAAGPEAPPPPFGSNAKSAVGRTFVLAIDEDSFRPGREGPLRHATDRLIAGLGSADRITLVTMPYGGVKVPLTTEHSRVRSALANIIGQAPARQTGSQLACRTRDTLETLVSYLDSLGVREEPVTLLFVTSGLAAPRRDAVSALPPGMCELQENLFTRVAVAAGAARTHVYVIRPGDAPDKGDSVQREGNLGSDNPLAGMDHLTGVTGGKLLSLTGSSGTALDRVLLETSAVYSATVEAQLTDRSGRSQPLDVRVTRRGVEVRAQPYVTFAKPRATVANMLEPSLRDMLASPKAFRDLPLRAAAFPALAADGAAIRVVAMAEPIEPNVKLESLGAVLFDKDGKVAAQWLATSEEMTRSPVTGAMAVLAGEYRLRVAAIDTAGRSGTADYDVTAEIARSGPLKIGSIVLGLSRGGAFVPRLQFTNEPLAVAYVELEGASAGSRVNAVLEIAQTLNGPPVLSVPLAIESAPNNRYNAMGSVAIGALPAGDYVVRALVGLEGHPMTRVARTIRKAKAS